MQSQFETVVKRFNKEQKEVEDLLQIRDQAYLDLLAGNDGQAVVPKQQIPPQKGQKACKVEDSTFTLMISITAHKKLEEFRTVILIADTSWGSQSAWSKALGCVQRNGCGLAFILQHACCAAQQQSVPSWKLSSSCVCRLAEGQLRVHYIQVLIEPVYRPACTISPMHIRQMHLKALPFLVRYRTAAFVLSDPCVSSSLALYIMYHSAVQRQ